MCKTQTESVLAHLEKYGSITSMEAIKLYGATRLSDIIFRLRRRGYTITTERFVVKTRYDRKTRPAKYILQKSA
jgi:hypothetical protein